MKQRSSKTEKTWLYSSLFSASPTSPASLQTERAPLELLASLVVIVGPEGGWGGLLVTLLSLLLCPPMPGQGSWRLHYCSCVDKRATSPKCYPPWVHRSNQRKLWKQLESNILKKGSCVFVILWFLWKALNVPSAATFSVPLVVALSVQLLFLKAPHPHFIIYTLDGN